MRSWPSWASQCRHRLPRLRGNELHARRRESEAMTELTIYNPVREAALLDDSARGPIRMGLAVMVLFFGGLGGWAAYAPLNGAVVAPAVVKVDSNRKTIQHLDGGI